MNTDGSVTEAPKDLKQIDDASSDGEDGILDQVKERRSRRECPVPKPGGVVGEILGFRSERDNDASGSRPP